MSRFSTVRALQKHPKYIDVSEVTMRCFRRELVENIFSTYDANLINRLLQPKPLYTRQLAESLTNDIR